MFAAAAAGGGGGGGGGARDSGEASSAAPAGEEDEAGGMRRFAFGTGGAPPGGGAGMAVEPDAAEPRRVIKSKHSSSSRRRPSSPAAGGHGRHEKRSRRDAPGEDLSSMVSRDAVARSRGAGALSMLSPYAPGADSTASFSWFLIDRLKDANNERYRGLYSKDVPLHYRAQSNRCLGVGPQEYIVWADGRDRRKRVLGDTSVQRRSTRYFSEESALKYLNPELKVDYVTPRLAARPKRLGARAPTAPEAPVRTIIPLDFASDESSGLTRVEYTTQKMGEFNAYLRDNPRDTAKWKEFAEFQRGSNKDSTRKAKALAAERQFAVYEQALKQNPRDTDLLCDYLELSRDQWDPEKLEKRWTHVLFTHAANPRLWRMFLQYATSELSRFKYPTAMTHFNKSIEIFRSLKNGTFASHQMEQGDAQTTTLEHIVESCYFQRDAGFGERSISCFQALVELNLFTPEKYKSNPEAARALASMETFFDTNTPRFGDNGALGFAFWLQQRQMGGTEAAWAEAHPEPDPPTPAGNEKKTKGSLEERWIETEVWRENTHWRPWRPRTEQGETEDDCEDPDRLVVFDDIGSHVCALPSRAVQLELIWAMLAFCGVSLRAQYSTNDTRTTTQARHVHSAGAMLQPVVACMNRCYDQMRPEEWEDFAKGYRREMRFLPHEDVWGPGWEHGQPASPRGDGRLGALCGGRRGWVPQAAIQDPSQRQFVRNVFRGALELFPASTELMLEHVAFVELAEGIKPAKKLAKTLLKTPKNRNNLLLLNLYAELEIRAGKPADATKVFLTALELSRSLAPEERAPSATLCRSFVEMCLDQQSPTQALRALVTFALEKESFSGLASAADLPPPPKTAILKAQRAYGDFLDAFLGSEAGKDAPQPAPSQRSAPLGLHPGSVCPRTLVDGIACAAHFAYQSDGFESAAAVYERALAAVSQQRRGMAPPVLEAGSLCHELVWTGYLRLVLLDELEGALRPRRARELVLRALGVFPNNPELLSVFVVGEAKCRVAGRLRSYFAASLSQRTESPLPWVLAICAEVVQRPTASANRVRTMFERALQSQARYSVLLWRMFLSFEFSQMGRGDDGQRLKAVFYRAIQVRPGCKRLYLDAARYDTSALQEVSDIFQEKELHLRTIFEEMEL